MDLRTGICPLCGHHEVIESVANEFGSGDYSASQMAVTHKHMEGGGPVGKRRDLPVGRLMLYVCRKCGYVQWFADMPESIPIGEKFQTRLIQGIPSQGPFR
jgi:hypothetical protein